MIVRSAFLLGHVAVEQQPDFDLYMREVVVSEIKKYPNIRHVSLSKTIQTDEGYDAAYMQFDLLFDSVEHMNEALSSPVRKEVQDTIRAGMTDFSGKVVHCVSQLLDAKK